MIIKDNGKHKLKLLISFKIINEKFCAFYAFLKWNMLYFFPFSSSKKLQKGSSICMIRCTLYILLLLLLLFLRIFLDPQVFYTQTLITFLFQQKERERKKRKKTSPYLRFYFIWFNANLFFRLFCKNGNI